MNIIIDTHIFLWLATDTKKISIDHMNYLKDLNNNIYLSSISIAEIAIKKSIGHLKFDADIMKLLEEMDINVLNFDTKSALMLEDLPFYHKDPFDRMIISQAIIHKYKIITVDNKFKSYACSLL